MRKIKEISIGGRKVSKVALGGGTVYEKKNSDGFIAGRYWDESKDDAEAAGWYGNLQDL